MRFDRFTSRSGSALILGTVLAGCAATAQTITEFPITTANSEPVGITVGPDDNLWFTEFGVGKIGRITTSGTVTEFPAAGNPQFIVVGSDNNLWFPEQTVHKIGRMTPSGGFTDFSIPTPGGLIGIAAGSDGNVWFCEASDQQDRPYHARRNRHGIPGSVRRPSRADRRWTGRQSLVHGTRTPARSPG